MSLRAASVLNIAKLPEVTVSSQGFHPTTEAQRLDCKFNFHLSFADLHDVDRCSH